jgi:hypothetical protein
MQATLSTTVEQMMTTGNPKIVHFRSRSAIEIKSTASPGSSSPSTSIKENARAGFGPLRGTQRAKRFPHCAFFERPMHGDQCVHRLSAKGLSESNFLLRRCGRIVDGRSAEMRHQLTR